MKMLRFNVRRKKHFSLLAIVLTSLIIPLILTLSIDYGHSWQNQNTRLNQSNEIFAYHREGAVSQYAFEHPSDPIYDNGYEMMYHYGVHDWIADSALRIIRLDPLIPKKYTNWIVDESIPYGDFDDFFNYGSGATEQRGWFSVHTKYGSNQDDRNWMRNRRYARFLHGTGVPDWEKVTQLEIYTDPIPFEAVFFKADWFAADSRWGHHFRFKPDGTIDFSHATAGEYAIQAADSAIHRFNYNKSMSYKNKRYDYKGKWEAGAFCLGGMTHFIADVSHPFHTVLYTNKHIYWDRFGDIISGWDEFGGFGRGGPDWSTVNPSLYSVALIPIDPWTAVKEMATFARDFGGDMDAANLPIEPAPSDLQYVNWVEKLLNKAVWYTACAMLWVLLQCDIPDDTFSDRWENGYPIGSIHKGVQHLYKAKMYHPPDIKTIREKIKAVEEGRDDWYNPGIGDYNLAYLAYFAPSIAVSLVSLTVPLIISIRDIYEKIFA